MMMMMMMMMQMSWELNVTSSASLPRSSTLPSPSWPASRDDATVQLTKNNKNKNKKKMMLMLMMLLLTLPSCFRRLENYRFRSAIEICVEGCGGKFRKLLSMPAV